jgi:peptide/nickel transport system permease protein
VSHVLEAGAGRPPSSRATRSRAVGAYLLPRLVQAVTTLLVLSAITFAATNAVPSDPARIALGHFATPQQITLFNQEQGLDKPVIQRYVRWLGHMITGNWGHSTLTSLPVSTMVGPRLERSLLLGLLATLLAVPLAYAIGVYCGQRDGRRSDTALSIVALFINSVPEFVIALVIAFVFAVVLRILPVESSAAAGGGAAAVKAYVLPTISVALLLVPYVLRMVRANVREVLGQPFVRSVTLRGVPRRRVVWRHVVPNASLPVINVVALSTAELIGGVVVIETVFGFPGIGQLFLTSVAGSDIPVVQAVAMIMGLGFVVLNFAADGVVSLLNPRLRGR